MQHTKPIRCYFKENGELKIAEVTDFHGTYLQALWFVKDSYNLKTPVFALVNK